MAKVLDKYNRVVACDSKYTGEEPRWDGCESWDPVKFMVNRNRMFGFYNYYLSAKDLKVFALEWMKINGYTKDEIKYIKSLRDTLPSVTTSKLCRALNNGMLPTCDGYKEYYKDRPGYSVAAAHDDLAHVKKEIKTLLSNYVKVVDTSDKPDSNQHKANISPIERLKNKVVSTVCAELDWMLDDWINCEPKVQGINVYSLLKQHTIPAAGLKYVEEWLGRCKSELVGAIEGDPDSVEGYSHLTKPAIRARIKELTKMEEQVSKFRATNTNARKPRKKKVQSADRQVKSLNYLAESDEYAVTSMSPSNIPGARRLYTFNIKYRRMTVYECSSTDGFTVKGTSIKGFDEKLSYSMSLRKPSDVISAVVTKTEKQLDKIIDTLTTKRKEANGRINDQTLILKVT
tara:strand:+ start:299 stop:1501 length:1203 start_codon:yes stop_codon:yes gene_type:complete